ncbi:hypothetical protein [Avibacterium paragallinarum]|uniref:hypothetical protein n=1 Tax=Avibacterium paragallinarum TaxID=728 RepID=UPI00188E5131|nr:hypothetical protein [Avibacterium paragallinarum]QZP14662.1 hypothetical protein K5O18_07330 [Avibacterium paragallinarum]WAL56729.1 hypothetical protein OY678_12570 [Avibacterium paragallinarum]WAM59254.1 hypothetical protein OW731_12290 [Avibacterium paragallinarum]
MAYINQQMKKEIMANVKKVLPQGWKASGKVWDKMSLELTVTLSGEDAKAWQEWESKMENAQTTTARFNARNEKPFADVIEALRKAMESLNSGEIDGSRDFCNKRYFTEMNIITA